MINDHVKKKAVKGKHKKEASPDDWIYRQGMHKTEKT